MGESQVKSLDTYYDGHKFRSRLEARWAVFFKTLGLRYRYEPEGFKFEDGTCYLPDFYLPEVGLRSTEEGGMWVEVKPLVESMSDVPNETERLTEETGEPVAVLGGKVSNGSNYIPDDHGHYQVALWDGQVWIDNYMRWCKCYNCGRVKYEFQETHYMVCEHCQSKCSYIHSEVEEAVLKARSARFEHGEKP